MAFDALKHRDVAEIERVFERLVAFVTRLAFAIREATEIDRMLYRRRDRNRCGPRGIGKHRVTDVAVVANHLPRVTHVLAIVTTKTA